MKQLLFGAIIMLAIISCKRSASTAESTTLPRTPVVTADSNASTSVDTVTTAVQPETPAVETKPLVPAKEKICAPNFTKLSSPKKNQYVIYVTGFNPEEFKCWVLLEEYGTELSAGNPCVIYYVDKANVKATTTPPHYLDDNTLKTAGIGRYEHNGKYWELVGASRWKRAQKGYGYYNTDNQAGG